MPDLGLRVCRLSDAQSSQTGRRLRRGRKLVGGDLSGSERPHGKVCLEAGLAVAKVVATIVFSTTAARPVAVARRLRVELDPQH